MLKTVWAAVAAIAVFGACNPETPKFAFKHAERRGKLESNGLRFVLMPDASTQLVEVDVRYEVGSKEDPPGKAGLAHLVEHMMFQLKPDGANTPALMQSIGDLTTFFNAYTNWDTTHYMNTARAENLDALLKIEAMRLYYGCQTISNEEFLREREVVRNEIRQRGGTAEGQIPQLVMSSVYPKGHAYERMIGGDDANLTTITLDDACKFIKDYYTPERATLIVAGGFEIDPTIELIQKWFGKLEKRTSGKPVEVAPFQVTPGRTEFDLDVERPSVHVAWALPPQNTPDGEMARYGLMQTFFRTAQKAQEYDFAYSVSPAFLGGQLAPVFAISIELKGLGKLDEALEFVNGAAKQAYRGFDEGTYDQIEEQKNRQKASFIEGMEALQARTNQIGELVQFSRDFDFNSQGLYIFHELDKISKFDGAKVGAVVKKYVSPDKAKIVVIKPNKEGIKGDRRNTKVKFEVKSHDKIVVPDVDPKEAKRPVKVAGELKALVGATHVTLGNGMKVVMLPIHSMPLVSARLIFNNVGEAIAPDNPWLASTAADFLSLPIDADAFMKTGISVGCSAGQDATTCSTSGINIYLDVMLKGLERLITAGSYHQEQIEGWQKNVRESLKTRSSQQENEFQRQVLTALYGADHPYTKTGVAVPEAIGKISKDTLESFRRTHYSAGNATLVIVGDFDPKQAESLARSTFGGWSKGHVDKPIDTTPFTRTGPAFIGVVGKEQPQLDIRIGFPAPAGVDGQQGARSVLAEMLNIRMADVRFKHGTTYGLYAARSTQKGPTAYQMGGTIDAERAGESIRAMRDGIDVLRKGGEQFDIDFVRARRNILSKLLGESTVTGELAGRLGFMAIHGLQSTYYNTLLQQVAAVSPAQVKALIAKELDPNSEVLVLLGDKPHLDKAFREAGLNDVKIVEPDYK
ncbi:MAG: pitrilysin family protein [Kofleriaceae bacterium]|nr:pitrilysin family protein [Kofleriaceae bacterium]